MINKETQKIDEKSIQNHVSFFPLFLFFNDFLKERIKELEKKLSKACDPYEIDEIREVIAMLKEKRVENQTLSEVDLFLFSYLYDRVGENNVQG